MDVCLCAREAAVQARIALGDIFVFVGWSEAGGGADKRSAIPAISRLAVPFNAATNISVSMSRSFDSATVTE